MTTQLSLFDSPIPKMQKKYIRDSVGRFATKERAEMERLKKDAEYYKFKFEQEQRKTKPVLARLIKVERELQILKTKQNATII